MGGLRLKISMGVVLFCAFIWGYKKDQLHTLLNSRTNTVNPEVEIPLSSVSKPSTSKIKGFAPPITSTTTTQRANRATTTAPDTSPQTVPARAKPATNTYLPPANPYANLSKQLKQPSEKAKASFREAFGSINRNSISQKELMKKNAYFRKLSQDLETLQGGKPVAGAQSNTTKPIEDESPQETLEPLEAKKAETTSNINNEMDEDFPTQDDINSEDTQEDAILDELDDLIDETMEAQ